ncbi:MAG: hypothetical protein K2N25_04770 [Muribaculaceae bacterium]|nr:hypothetical protein [Muribaculaceae bacterium]
MNYLYILFVFIFMLSSCHSHKESCTQATYVQEVARSDVTISDVDAGLSRLVNRNIVVTLEDVVVQYQGEDTSMVSNNRSPDIRSPTAPARLYIGKVEISDISEESTNLHVEDNSIQVSDLHAAEAADLEQEVKQESAQLHSSQGSFLMILLCILLLAVVLVILYRKGKLRL